MFPASFYFERMDVDPIIKNDELRQDTQVAVAAICDESIGVAVGYDLDDECNPGTGIARMHVADAKRLRAMLGRAIREVEKMERGNG